MELIAAFTQPDQLIYDPFAGACTTIMAAHNLDRIGYACEIEPQYCDLSVDRLQRHIGQSAVNQHGVAFDKIRLPFLVC